MRPNVPSGQHASRQSRYSSTVDTRVMKPNSKTAKHSTRSNVTPNRSVQKSKRNQGSKPVSSPSSKGKTSSSRRTNSRRTYGSSSAKDRRPQQRAASESRRRAQSQKSSSRRDYYSDYSEDSSSDEYSEYSDSYTSEGDMATQLDDRGVVVNASDLSECWSKVSIQSEEESAFQRYAKKVEAKEKQNGQNGFFFSGPQDEVSLPSLDTKAQTTFTLADTTYTDAYSQSDAYTRGAYTYDTGDDTYTRSDTYTEADTATRADTYTEADTYTRDDSYTEADSRTYGSTYYGRSDSDSESDYTYSDDSGTQGAGTYYTNRTQHTEAVQGNMWMCGGGQVDDDTLGAPSYGGLRNNEVLIASSATIATFETREDKDSWRTREDSQHSPKEKSDKYGRLISSKQTIQKPKQSNGIKKWSQPKNSQRLQQAEKPKPPPKSAHRKRASATTKLEKIEESQNEGTQKSILALPLQWWYGKTREDEKRKKESTERLQNAKRDLLVKPHLHIDGLRGYDGSLTLDARVRKDAEEGGWSSGNPQSVDLDGRVKKVTETEILNGKKNQSPPEPTPTPPSAFAPKETQKIDVWTDGDTEVESVIPPFSGQCKVEAFGAPVVHRHQGGAAVGVAAHNDQQEEFPEPVPSSTRKEEDRGPSTLHEEMQDAAFDTVWIAPSAMSRMSFESQQTLPTINTTHQSVATKEQKARLNVDENSMTSLPKTHGQKKNFSVSNLINAFEKNLVGSTTPDEQNQNRARADWRSPGPLVSPVVPVPAWIASAQNNDQEGRESPEQMMDPEQMKNQQRCLFDDEVTEVTDEPSTMLQLDDNGQVSAGAHVAFDSTPIIDNSDPFEAFDTTLPFLGSTDPEAVQPMATTNATRAQFVKKEEEYNETAFSTNKNNDVEYFGQFKRESLQSEPSKTAKAFKPRRRRNAAGKVKSFLSSFPRRNQKNTLQSYHQLDDDSYHNWGTTGSTVVSKVHEDLGFDDHHHHHYDGMTKRQKDDDDCAHDAIVQDAMETINGAEQLMRDADSFFAAGSFYEALEDGFSVD